MTEQQKRGDFAMRDSDGTTKIRFGKVAHILYAIEAGSYYVTSEEVASKMVTAFLLNELSVNYRDEMYYNVSKN